MRRVLQAAIAAISIVLSGCAITPKPDLSAFIAAAPRSILVVPAINKTLDVDAPNYLLSTLTIPLAEKGFYVFPVNTVKVVLEQEGYYEGEQVHRQPPEALAKLFGADAVLYVTINRWDAQYAILAATVTVDFDYRIAYRDGRELWRTNQRMQYSPQASNAGHPLATLLVAVINAAVTRAAPNYLPLTQQANSQVFVIGPAAIPNGPYRTANPVGQISPVYVASKPTPTMAVAPTQLVDAASQTKTAPAQVPAAPSPVPTPVLAVPTSSVPKPDQAVVTVPKQALRGGKDSFQARRLARDLSCSADPTVVLTEMVAGAETYSTLCSDGNMLAISCSFGTCSVK